MRLVAGYVRLTRKRRYVRSDGGAAMLAAPKGPSDPPDKLSRDLRVGTREVGGFAVHVVRRREPAASTPDVPVVLFLHGGAYVNEIVSQHWELVAHLARCLDAEVQVPIYGLAPDHTAAEATALTATLVDEAHDAGRACWLVGDSAGGGLALLTAQARPDRVTGVSVIAPWVDLTLANPEIDEVEPRDPWLARAALHEVAEAWAGDVPRDDPRVSPLVGPMAGLPPVDLYVGTRDITLPDSRLLRDRLQQAGVEVTYHEEPDAIHDYPLLPVPEGRAARDDLVAHVRAGLARPAAR